MTFARLYCGGWGGADDSGMSVMASLDMDDVTLIGVAKGRSRTPGKESIWVHGQAAPYTLSLS